MSILEQWSEMLRSGKYKQARSLLADSKERRCCLGVAVDVLGCEDEWDYNVAGEKIEWSLRGQFVVLLPEDLQTRLFESVAKPDVWPLTEMFVELNDHYELTFDEIAGIVDILDERVVVPLEEGEADKLTTSIIKLLGTCRMADFHVMTDHLVEDFIERRDENGAD